MAITTETVNRVVWAQFVPAGEFGEIERGDEGTVIDRQSENGEITWLTVEFDAGVALDVQPWDVDFLN